MNRLKEKLRFEWEKFYMDCTRTSKDNIFTKALEISKKQEIKQYLIHMKKVECDEIVLKRMLGAENVIESCYRYVVDYGISNLRQDVRSWMKSLREQ